jgi:hypothetical protein
MSGGGWKWRTFPVVAAFVFGALAASLIDRPDNDFVLGVRVMLVLAAAYCVAHIAVVYVLLPRRRGARGSGVGDVVEYEDELVYEDETPTKR